MEGDNSLNTLFEGKKTVLLGNANLIAGAFFVLLGLSLILYAVPEHIALGFGSKRFALVGPRTLPYGVAVVMLLCGLKTMHTGYREKKLHALLNKEHGKTVSFHGIAFVVIVIGLLFTASMPYIGYPAANILTVGALYYLSGGKRITTGVFVSVLFTTVSVLFFSVYLKISIPMGWGF